MIDAETGLPTDPSQGWGITQQQNPSAPTMPASAPPPPGFNQQPNASGSGIGAASTQPAFAGAPAGFNQQPNAMGYGMSPLLMQLLGSGGGELWPLLMQYYMGQGGGMGVSTQNVAAPPPAGFNQAPNATGMGTQIPSFPSFPGWGQTASTQPAYTGWGNTLTGQGGSTL